MNNDTNPPTAIPAQAVEAAGCNCGCGKDRATVVREIARHEGLNYDQAEDRMNRANATRAEQTKGEK